MSACSAQHNDKEAFLFKAKMEHQQHRSYYAIIPAYVRYDADIPANAKLLFGEITALCNERGYCWATNTYFSELYGVSKVSVSKWVSSLVQKGYISSEITYREGTREIESRLLTICPVPIKEKFNTSLTEVIGGIKEKLNTPIKEKLKDNSTVNNNTVNSSSFNSHELKGGRPGGELLEEPKPKKEKKKTPQVARSPLFVKCMDIYWNWYKSRNNDTPPKIDGAEGKGLKSLTEYLMTITAAKMAETGENGDLTEKAAEAFTFILGKWESLEPFLQKQVKLSQINSNISNIINHIKNGRKSQSTQQAKQDRAGTISDSFNKLEELFRDKGYNGN